MKKTRFLIATSAMLLGSLVHAGEAPDLNGARLYAQFCASCHGVTARGDGPVASQMKVKVPDLTRIAVRAGGRFSALEVQQIIDGRSLRPAHGSADMPVWGWEFYAVQGDDGARRKRVDEIIGRLVDYLRSIQEK